jgi:hypothetical protein
MKLDTVRKLTPLERWQYWIKEREAIRQLKGAGFSQPWTDDEILQQYRFCNVRRMDDKVSQWLLNNWYLKFYNHPNMLVACAIARHFNLPDALRPITHLVFTDSYGPERIKQAMRDRKARGNTIFNGAYMVRGIGTADKTEMVIDKVVQPLIDNPPKVDRNSMQNTVEALLPYWGFSLFMAGQVAADWRWAVSCSMRDRKRWAPMGPGSKRGMNRLKERPINFPLHQDQFLTELQWLIGVGNQYLPPRITDRLEAIDWQNTLCEFDKYSRALLGEGRPKQKYQGA